MIRIEEAPVALPGLAGYRFFALGEDSKLHGSQNRYG